MNYIGMDIALRHGAIVSLNNGIYQREYVYENSPVMLNLPIDKAFQEIHTLTQSILQITNTWLLSDTLIAFDADVNTFFQSKNVQKVYTGALYYSIYIGLLIQGHTIIFVKPSDIRTMLGLKRNAKKELVLEAVSGIIPYIKSKTMDEMDARILAYYIERVHSVK